MIKQSPGERLHTIIRRNNLFCEEGQWYEQIAAIFAQPHLDEIAALKEEVAELKQRLDDIITTARNCDQQ